MPTSLCGTPVGSELTNLMEDRLTMGNRSNADCEYIYIRGSRLEAKFNLRSKHVWSSGITAYDVSYDVSIDEDIRNPHPAGVKICVDVRGIPLCVTLEDILALLAVAFKTSQAQQAELSSALIDWNSLVPSSLSIP